MIDRQKLETLMSRRFPGATREQIAAAANAIMGIEDEWEEIASEQEFGYHVSVQCGDICALARQAETGTEFRLLRRRESGSDRPASGNCPPNGAASPLR